MYNNNMGPQPGMPRPPGNPQPGPFGNPFTGPASGFIRGGLGAYGERILGSSSEYVQSNVSVTSFGDSTSLLTSLFELVSLLLEHWNRLLVTSLIPNTTSK